MSKSAYRSAITLVSAAVFAGCAGLPEEATRPLPSANFTLARESAVMCAEPQRPRLQDTSQFKYGCFCGKAHPHFAPDASEAAAAFGEAKLAVHIARYYAVKPYDDLDAACQDHDICYVMHGRSRRSCDEAFSRRMRILWSEFQDEDVQSHRNPKSRSLVNPMAGRCSSIAMHLTLAEYFFEGQSESQSYEVVAGAINLLTGGLAIPLAAAILPLSAYPDPAVGERCNIADNVAVSLPDARRLPR